MKLYQAAVGLFSLLMILFFCVSSPAGTNEEIASLLQFVEQSKCVLYQQSMSSSFVKLFLPKILTSIRIVPIVCFKPNPIIATPGFGLVSIFRNMISS